MPHRLCNGVCELVGQSRDTFRASVHIRNASSSNERSCYQFTLAVYPTAYGLSNGAGIGINNPIMFEL